MIRRPPRSTLSSSSAASDVYKRQILGQYLGPRPLILPVNIGLNSNPFLNSSCTSSFVCVIKQLFCSSLSECSFRYENVPPSSSPFCSVISLKSIDLPSILALVPVFILSTEKPKSSS